MSDGDRGDRGGGAPRRKSLRIAHHHPGRVRLRADDFLTGPGNDGVERVRATLEGQDGVRSFKHTPQTGSVLIEYDPARIEVNRVIALVAGAAGLSEVVDGDKQDPADLAGAVADVVGAANDAVVEVSGGRTDLRGVVSAALAGASIYSLFSGANGPAMPRWDNLLWWSFNLYSQARARNPNAVAPMPPPPPPSGPSGDT